MQILVSKSRLLLVQMMACHLLGTKPSSETLLVSSQLNIFEQMIQQYAFQENYFYKSDVKRRNTPRPPRSVYHTK